MIGSDVQPINRDAEMVNDGKLLRCLPHIAAPQQTQGIRASMDEATRQRKLSVAVGEAGKIAAFAPQLSRNKP